MPAPIATSTATNRSRASFTKMMKSNHYHAFRQPFKSGGARKPPSSIGGCLCLISVMIEVSVPSAETVHHTHQASRTHAARHTANRLTRTSGTNAQTEDDLKEAANETPHKSELDHQMLEDNDPVERWYLTTHTRPSILTSGQRNYGSLPFGNDQRQPHPRDLKIRYGDLLSERRSVGQFQPAATSGLRIPKLRTRRTVLG